MGQGQSWGSNPLLLTYHFMTPEFFPSFKLNPSHETKQKGTPLPFLTLPTLYGSSTMLCFSFPRKCLLGHCRSNMPSTARLMNVLMVFVFCTKSSRLQSSVWLSVLLVDFLLIVTCHGVVQLSNNGSLSKRDCMQAESTY